MKYLLPLISTGLLFLSIVTGQDTNASAETHSLTRAVIFNEDNSHFFFTRSPESMTREGLHAFIDQYAGTAITHLFLCSNAQRASFRSRSREAIWDPAPEMHESSWPTNARLLHERGLDRYAIWIDRARQQGISPWLSMRMNDVHNVLEPGLSMHSAFWRDHPEFWIVPHSASNRWEDRSLDFSHPEVRKHAMDFIEELLERYDPDGLELDWMRFGYHFPPGKEHLYTDVLTEFMTEVKARVDEWSDKRGHPIALGVRVPTHPDAAKGLGMDAITWAEKELIDLIVAAPFWFTTDNDIPIELWHKRLQAVGSDIPVIPGIEHNSRPWKEAEPMVNDLPALYGWASSMRYRGADSFYLFNWMDSDARPVSEQDYRYLFEHGLGADHIRSVERRHILTYRDTVPYGFPDNTVLPVDLDRETQFALRLGRIPETGMAKLIVGLSQDPSTTVLTAIINGNGPLTMNRSELPERIGGDPATVRTAVIPLDQLVDGQNWFSLAGNPQGAGNKVVWAEVHFQP